MADPKFYEPRWPYQAVLGRIYPFKDRKSGIWVRGARLEHLNEANKEETFDGLSKLLYEFYEQSESDGSRLIMPTQTFQREKAKYECPVYFEESTSHSRKAGKITIYPKHPRDARIFDRSLGYDHAPDIQRWHNFTVFFNDYTTGNTDNGNIAERDRFLDTMLNPIFD